MCRHCTVVSSGCPASLRVVYALALDVLALDVLAVDVLALDVALHLCNSSSSAFCVQFHDPASSAMHKLLCFLPSIRPSCTR